MWLIARGRGPPLSVALYILRLEGNVQLSWLTHTRTHTPLHPPPQSQPQHHTSAFYCNLTKLTTTPDIIPHHTIPPPSTTTPSHHHTTTPPHHQNKQNMSDTVFPQLMGKNITFPVIGQITNMNHQNNQEEKCHLLCDGQCPDQIRLFTTGGLRRPYQVFFCFFLLLSFLLNYWG